MDSGQDRVRLERSPTRCPYCHEDVQADATEWVACTACLGRHHEACWSDAGRCAACGHAEPLRPAEPAPRTASAGSSPAVGTRVEHGRADLLGVLDAHERADAGPGPVDWVLSPLTLFLHAPLAAEARLKRHARESAGDLTVAPTGGAAIDDRLARYRRDALDETEARATRRQAVVGAIFGVCFTTVLVGGIIAASRAVGSDSDEVGAVMASIAGGVWFLTLHVAAWLHRRAVAWHEQKQLAFGLLAQGADAEAARQALERQRRAWESAWLPLPERGLVVNLLWYVVALLGLPALFGAPLRLHVRREGEERPLQRPGPKG